MRTCVRCETEFNAKHSRHRFCSAECRKLRELPIPVAPHMAALGRQVEAMATGEEHHAMVESLRGLATRLDTIAEIGGFDDKVQREYRLMLKDLREATCGDSADPYNDFIEDLRGVAEIRDTPNAGS